MIASGYVFPRSASPDVALQGLAAVTEAAITIVGLRSLPSPPRLFHYVMPRLF